MEMKKTEGLVEGEMKKAKETTYELVDMGLSCDKIARAVKVNLETVKKWTAERPVTVK